MTSKLNQSTFTGQLPPQWDEQTCVPSGADESAGAAGGCMDPSSLFQSHSETQRGRGGPGGGQQGGHRGTSGQCGGLHLPTGVHRRLLSGQHTALIQLAFDLNT